MQYGKFGKLVNGNADSKCPIRIFNVRSYDRKSLEEFALLDVWSISERLKHLQVPLYKFHSYSGFKYITNKRTKRLKHLNKELLVVLRASHTLLATLLVNMLNISMHTIYFLIMDLWIYFSKVKTFLMANL